jgi:hypothetical protein
MREARGHAKPPDKAQRPASSRTPEHKKREEYAPGGKLHGAPEGAPRKVCGSRKAKKPCKRCKRRSAELSEGCHGIGPLRSAEAFSDFAQNQIDGAGHKDIDDVKAVGIGCGLKVPDKLKIGAFDSLGRRHMKELFNEYRGGNRSAQNKNKEIGNNASDG